MLVGADGVEQLVHAGHAEGGHVEHLGLAPLEQAPSRGPSGTGRPRPTAAGCRPCPGRRCGRPRSTMRWRTSFLVSDRTAALISPLAVGELAGQLGHDGRGGLVDGRVALGLGRDGVGLGHRGRCRPPPPVSTRRRRSRLKVSNVDRLDGAAGRHHLGHQPPLEVDRLADPGLGRLQPVGQDLLGHLGGPALVVLPGALGPAGLDHHDGDVGVVAVAEGPAGHHQLEGGLVALLVGGVGDPRRPRSSRRCGRRRSGRRRGCPRA